MLKNLKKNHNNENNVEYTKNLRTSNEIKRHRVKRFKAYAYSMMTTATSTTSMTAVPTTDTKTTTHITTSTTTTTNNSS